MAFTSAAAGAGLPIKGDAASRNKVLQDLSREARVDMALLVRDAAGRHASPPAARIMRRVRFMAILSVLSRISVAADRRASRYANRHHFHRHLKT